MVAVVGIGLLAVVVGQVSRQPVNLAGTPRTDAQSAQCADPTQAQDQLAANLTDQFLNQLDAYSSH